MATFIIAIKETVVMACKIFRSRLEVMVENKLEFILVNLIYTISKYFHAAVCIDISDKVRCLRYSYFFVT